MGLCFLWEVSCIVDGARLEHWWPCDVARNKFNLTLRKASKEDSFGRKEIHLLAPCLVETFQHTVWWYWTVNIQFLWSETFKRQTYHREHFYIKSLFNIVFEKFQQALLLSGFVLKMLIIQHVAVYPIFPGYYRDDSYFWAVHFTIWKTEIEEAKSGQKQINEVVIVPVLSLLREPGREELRQGSKRWEYLNVVEVSEVSPLLKLVGGSRGGGIATDFPMTPKVPCKVLKQPRTQPCQRGRGTTTDGRQINKNKYRLFSFSSLLLTLS